MRYDYLAFITSVLLTVTAYGEKTATPSPPWHAAPPLPQHAVTNRAFTGISSMAVAPNGRLWVTWYAGKTPGEDLNNYVVLATSDDDGQSWKELMTVDPDAEGPRRTYDPEVWIAPDGKMRWIWGDRSNPKNNVRNDTVWMSVLDDPTSESTAWHPPVYITQGVMMCKPIVLTTGEWVLPVATWFVDNSAKMVVSSDQGKSWSVRGACNVPKEVRNCDEHMFVERKDGSLWLLVRTKYGIGESVSSDRGKTWPDLKPSAISHPTARFFISRLISGNLLLVKHGPIDKKIGRSHLTAFISTDDGRSWGGGLLLDERSGVSYPDGQQTADGTIYITYDYSRTSARHILFTTFREEDAAAGKVLSKSVRLRQLVSEGSGGVPRKDSGKPKPIRDNADGIALNRQTSGTWKCSDSFDLKPQSKLFSDRSYTLSELPAPLKDAHFLRVKMDGAKTLSCGKAGMLYFLTPAPDRNNDSVSKELIDQGFQTVSLPEVRLFNRSSTANYCTLYQKSCATGETVKFGKWALPIFFSREIPQL